MITSALITECRREVDDMPKATRRLVPGDGSSTLFNTGNFPIIEGSYHIYVGTSARTEITHYTLDKDTGDLVILSAPSLDVKAEFKYAHWRDRHWTEAINKAIKELNARGYFRQIVRNTTIMSISANVVSYSGPSGCVDLYEVLESDNSTTSGNFKKLETNWSYQQDANKLVLGGKPSAANKLAISYLRNLQTYTATSATVDVLDEWVELVKMKAQALFWRSLAGKVAKQGNATIEDGHISYSNLRAQATDLENQFNVVALRKKPTRPAKDFQYHIAGSGPA